MRRRRRCSPRNYPFSFYPHSLPPFSAMPPQMPVYFYPLCCDDSLYGHRIFEFVEMVRGVIKIRLVGASEQGSRSSLSCCLRCKLGLNASSRARSAAASGRRERWLDPSSDLPYSSPPPAFSASPPQPRTPHRLSGVRGLENRRGPGRRRGARRAGPGGRGEPRARLAESWAPADREASAPFTRAPWVLKASSVDLGNF